MWREAVKIFSGLLRCTGKTRGWLWHACSSLTPVHHSISHHCMVVSCMAQYHPRGQQWYPGTKAAVLVSLRLILSLPVIHPFPHLPLPPFGIFLVQWPPFTTITQISWAGIILSIALHRLEGGGGGVCVAEFPFCLCDSAIWQRFTSPLLSPHYTPLSDKEINTPSDCVLIKQFHANYTF